jgi:proteasome lid subunit RPN8/RPN11
VYREIVGAAYDGLPDEACGLLVGRAHPWPEATAFYRCANADRSSRTYSIDGHELLRLERQADDAGLDVLGVMHSHTHTTAYPSPTDVERALPGWHYVIVSLRDGDPVLRSYLIEDGNISEEKVVLMGR